MKMKIMSLPEGKYKAVLAVILQRLIVICLN